MATTNYHLVRAAFDGYIGAALDFKVVRAAAEYLVRSRAAIDVHVRIVIECSSCGNSVAFLINSTGNQSQILSSVYFSPGVLTAAGCHHYRESITGVIHVGQR